MARSGMALELVRVNVGAYVKHPCTPGFEAVVVLPRAPLSSRILPITSGSNLVILMSGDACKKAIL